ncbi:MAG TPA: hypothetical protein VEQ59_04245, partial [Polyangiaceae bacterium]|nr:hypothetical protein [Polyangiaceae bacterium]
MRRAAVAWLLLSLTGCSHKSADHGPQPLASSAAASVVASVSAPSPAASGVPSASAPSTPTCRALRVEGDARLGEAPLRSGAELDGSEWVTLGAGATLTVKHTVSGREIGVAGPARFRACRRGREQLLLARGKVQGGSGMGARPGAEVLIATPIAAVRYGDADYALTLDDRKLAIEVRTGQVEVDAAASEPPPGLKSPLRAKDKLSLPLGKPDAASLMARCKAAAEDAETSARRVGDRSAPEPLGERARAHVRARKAARAACTVAAAATG